MNKGGSYFLPYILIGLLHNAICSKVACLTEQIIYPLFFHFLFPLYNVFLKYTPTPLFLPHIY